MYKYDQYDQAMVDARVEEFRDQARRRLEGKLTEDQFKPLRLMNGLYLQLHAYMLRVAIPYGTLDSRQMHALADIADKYDRGYGHFTTRQNLQHNWIKLADAPDILAELSKHPVKTRLSLSGSIIVARDIAHAKLKERLDAGDGLPQYFKDHGVYYAGPAKTPEGMASGSFGPTTAGRMDSYVDQFQSFGGSMVMLAKGNRSRQVREACARHGGFYLGSIGGPAARLAQDCIKKVEVVEYPELGMEAIWRIEVEDFPAFIVIDDKGNDFFKELNLG